MCSASHLFRPGSRSIRSLLTVMCLGMFLTNLPGEAQLFLLNGDRVGGRAGVFEGTRLEWFPFGQERSIHIQGAYIRQLVFPPSEREPGGDVRVRWQNGDELLTRVRDLKDDRITLEFPGGRPLSTPASTVREIRFSPGPEQMLLNAEMTVEAWSAGNRQTPALVEEGLLIPPRFSVQHALPPMPDTVVLEWIFVSPAPERFLFNLRLFQPSGRVANSNAGYHLHMGNHRVLLTTFISPRQQNPQNLNAQVDFHQIPSRFSLRMHLNLKEKTGRLLLDGLPVGDWEIGDDFLPQLRQDSMMTLTVGNEPVTLTSFRILPSAHGDRPPSGPDIPEGSAWVSPWRHPGFHGRLTGWKDGKIQIRSLDGKTSAWAPEDLDAIYFSEENPLFLRKQARDVRLVHLPGRSRLTFALEGWDEAVFRGNSPNWTEKLEIPRSFADRMEFNVHGGFPAPADLPLVPRDTPHQSL